jgi:NNP family nitrate/nitrite transporter-like MFS transporter
VSERGQANTVLVMSTLSFVVCFAVWMMNGVLVTYLVDNRVFSFDKAQIGWLMGLPVLTGSILRLPVGIATDRWGGRLIFTLVMLVAAVATFGMSYADSYSGFVLGSLGFGVAGTSFSVGIAYTSIWFKKENQGTALGIFGAGNAGSAVTSIGAGLSACSDLVSRYSIIIHVTYSNPTDSKL